MIAEEEEKAIPDSKKSNFNIPLPEQNIDFRKAANYVYRHFLTKPYTEGPVADRQTALPRANHNIAHVLRTIASLLMVLAFLEKFSNDKELRNFCSHAKKTPSFMMTLLHLPLLFLVTGRDSEVEFSENGALHLQYRKASAENFAAYCKTVGVPDETITLLKGPMVHYGSPPCADDSPTQRYIKGILQLVHSLDLPRILPQVFYDPKITKCLEGLGGTSANEKEIASLQLYAINLIHATGCSCSEFEKLGIVKKDGAPFSHSLFFACSTDIDTCLSHLTQVQKPAFSANIQDEHKGIKLSYLPSIGFASVGFFSLTIASIFMVGYEGKEGSLPFFPENWNTQLAETNDIGLSGQSELSTGTYVALALYVIAIACIALASYKAYRVFQSNNISEKKISSEEKKSEGLGL